MGIVHYRVQVYAPNYALMFLSKQRNGYWYLFYKDITGKRRPVTTHSRNKSDADKFMRSFKENEHPIKENSITLSEFFNKLKSVSSLRTGTIEIYKYAFDRLIEVSGDIPIKNVSRMHVDALKSSRLAYVSASTVNIDMRSLRAAFYTAQRWDFISSNPFTDCSFPKPPKSPPLFFSRSDFDTFISYEHDTMHKILYQLAVLTGLRQGELLNLRYDNIDMIKREILVASTSTHTTKGGEMRTVPLSQKAFDIIYSMQRRGDFVFVEDGKLLNVTTLQHRFKRIVREAKLNDDLHFHSLRHTFASWLVQAGVDIYRVKELMGHANIETTMMYAHLMPSHLHDAVKVLDK